MSVRRLATGILAVPLLLSACGGGDDSVADPPISSAPTSSATGTPPRESAEHFIRRWAAENTRMQNSGDSSAFRGMSSGCNGCDAVADRVDSIYGAGGEVHTDGWTRIRITESARVGRSHTIELLVESSPTTYTLAKGAAPKHLDGGREHFQVQVQPKAKSWTVTQFVQVGS
jgi:hypothetical protein